jgi:hypothetical protein
MIKTVSVAITFPRRDDPSHRTPLNADGTGEQT